MGRAVLLAAVVATVSASPLLAERLLYAGSKWASFERPGGICEAVSRSEAVAAPGRPQARIAIAFARDGRRKGQLHALFARPVRPGGAAVLTIGSATFLLLANGNSAWSRGPLQEQAILSAIRTESEMRIRAQGLGGSISDRYLLTGAPTAIDAAAIACSS